MPPLTIGVDPYALPTIGAPQSNNSLSSWLFQPLQQNSSGTLPGTTVMNIGNVIQINGNKDYILISNPTTSIPSLIMGLLPDGSTGMVVAKSGVSVLSIFN